MFVVGDARALPLTDRSVQCCTTSPPYWGLREYKTPPLIWDGEACCEHVWGTTIPGSTRGGSGPGKKRGSAEEYGRASARGSWCQSCGAWLGHLGLEPTPELYVQHLVGIFREVRRVLRDDGTVWLNLGDSYAGVGYSKQDNTGGAKRAEGGKQKHSSVPDGCKPKDLIGIPWLVAFALRADGWYLRSDIIWAKAHEFCSGGVGSAMPLGGKHADRPTPAHEYLFLLSKSSRYFYDEKAVSQVGVFPAGTRAAKGSGHREGNRRGSKQDGVGSRADTGFNERYFSPTNPAGYAVYSGRRRLRDVWFISPQGFKEAHFATFPRRLVEPCIKAGSRPGDLILDPFGGAGTVALAAADWGRRSLCLDLALPYAMMAAARFAKDRRPRLD
jgi:DNA modification methylase